MRCVSVDTNVKPRQAKDANTALRLQVIMCKALSHGEGALRASVTLRYRGVRLASLIRILEAPIDVVHY